MAQTSFRGYVLAVDRVEKRLRKVTAALDAAGVKYAVIGGNAVAAWVARVDPSATRSTPDVDLLVNQSDLESIDAVMQTLDFRSDTVARFSIYRDPDEPSMRSILRLVLANQSVESSDLYSTPSLNEAERDPQGFIVISLPALVRMKLTAYRTIDRVHIEDLLNVHVIDSVIRARLSSALQTRLTEIERALEVDLVEF
jgi:hypothetical protein